MLDPIDTDEDIIDNNLPSNQVTALQLILDSVTAERDKFKARVNVLEPENAQLKDTIIELKEENLRLVQENEELKTKRGFQSNDMGNTFPLL